MKEVFYHKDTEAQKRFNKSYFAQKRISQIVSEEIFASLSLRLRAFVVNFYFCEVGSGY